VSALYGLYDFTLITTQPEIEAALAASVQALVSYLPRFDAHFWSFYDTSGTIASPYYHGVHINQLKALSLTFGCSDAFKNLQDRFQKQAASRVCRSRAIVKKTFQKLTHPPATVTVHP
jgi:hypothetical protein